MNTSNFFLLKSEHWKRGQCFFFRNLILFSVSSLPISESSSKSELDVKKCCWVAWAFLFERFNRWSALQIKKHKISISSDFKFPNVWYESTIFCAKLFLNLNLRIILRHLSFSFRKLCCQRTLALFSMSSLEPFNQLLNFVECFHDVIRSTAVWHADQFNKTRGLASIGMKWAFLCRKTFKLLANY